MTDNFYDKVAKKFGNYHTRAHYTTEYPTEDPEEVFKQKLLEVGSRDAVVLDAGCADGRNALALAGNFRTLVAIDVSDGMLEAARRNHAQSGVENIVFEKQNAQRTTYGDASFDIIYSRRGPCFYEEFFRLLKPGGYFVNIGIGEKDAMELKLVFGRGQNFGEWEIHYLETERAALQRARFDTTYAKEFFYNEYYLSYQDLELFLQGVPIFEDFDSEQDRIFLETYATRFQTEKGIRLSRHRTVIVARK